jgi:hypothetical protein
MAQTRSPRRAEGDQEAILFIVSIAVGAAALVFIEAVVGRDLLGESLGFFGMWVVIFPFARRTWAAELPAWRYWTAAVTGTVVGAALRLLIR